ncbi:MAG TPA: hypothetical protein VMG32_04910 [Anaeromyxobacteraceae bacterium]|nr:hypothetical protein [Anaeromyxobacteraceae bacterium]
MPEITDEYMKRMLAQTRDYAVVLLRPGPRYREPGGEAVIWEHGRRNFSLRAEGRMPIVLPVRGPSEVCGVCVFTGTPAEVRTIMEGDPGVVAGIFTFEVYPCRSFPGDRLPD